MDITPEIKIIDKSLLIGKTLIISDIHIGYEEAMNKQGILVPRNHFNDLVKDLGKILKKTGKLDKIIINGDLKHEFGKISETEWRHTLRFLDLLSRHTQKLILIKGNHDNILEPIAKKRNIEIKDYEFEDGILIAHGDKIIKEKGIKTIIIGHEHPAITLKENSRAEKFKCFIKGRYKLSDIIVIPSFNPLIEGTDILESSHFSPYMKDISDKEVYVVSDKIYYFGKLKNIRNY